MIERQSNFTATLEIPPPFEAPEIGMEGTGEPFIARVFLGIIDMASNVLSQTDKAEFDERLYGRAESALSLRNSLVAIRKLISRHREALQSGKIVRKVQIDPVISERIDGPLRSHTVNLLELADAIIEGLPAAMKFFQINIEYLADRGRKIHTRV